MTAVPPRPSNTGLLAAVALSAVLLILLGWKLMGSKPELDDDNGSAFNVSEVPKDNPASPASYESRFEREARDRMKPGGGGPGLAGFIPETGGRYQAGGAPGSASGSSAGGDRAVHQPSAAERAREVKMWAKHEPVYRRWGGKMMAIGRRYRNKYPAVKKADRYFGGMPRFMALKKQHDAGKIDAYQYWRQVVALPEFRAGVRKFAGDPQILKAGVQMTGEALATKPPKELYGETFRMITEDKAVTGFMSEEFWPQVTPKLPMTLLSTPMPPGTSASDVQDLASQLSAAQAGRVKNLQAEAMKNYRPRQQ